MPAGQEEGAEADREARSTSESPWRRSRDRTRRPRINAGTRTPEIPEWSRWTTAERRRLVRECADEATRYGYDLDGDVSLPSMVEGPSVVLTPQMGRHPAAATAVG